MDSVDPIAAEIRKSSKNTQDQQAGNQQTVDQVSDAFLHELCIDTATGITGI